MIGLLVAHHVARFGGRVSGDEAAAARAAAEPAGFARFAVGLRGAAAAAGAGSGVDSGASPGSSAPS
ncbi:TPA: hypothetical protein QDB63_001721, partial [Burkholderia multivorans]|nr:hypothetical protein [Burkholderia multivorans]